MLDLPNLEINIAEHCNLKCHGCDHSSPFMPARFIEAELLGRWMEPFRGLRIGKLKLIGGEPLLHPNIPELIHCLRELNVAEEIGIVTNGTLLHRQNDEFWEAIDFLKVTRYPGIRVRLSDDELQHRSAVFGVRLSVVERNLFRYTVLDEPIEDEAMVEAIYRACELPRSLGCHTLRDGKLFKCSPSAFLGDRLGVSHCSEDGLDLAANEDVATSIRAYLNDREPLRSCRYCLGTSGKDFPVQQRKAGDDCSNTPSQSNNWIELLDRTRLASVEKS